MRFNLVLLVLGLAALAECRTQFTIRTLSEGVPYVVASSSPSTPTVESGSGGPSNNYNYNPRGPYNTQQNRGGYYYATNQRDVKIAMDNENENYNQDQIDVAVNSNNTFPYGVSSSGNPIVSTPIVQQPPVVQQPIYYYPQQQQQQQVQYIPIYVQQVESVQAPAPSYQAPVVQAPSQPAYQAPVVQAPAPVQEYIAVPVVQYPTQYQPQYQYHPQYQYQPQYQYPQPYQPIVQSVPKVTYPSYTFPQIEFPSVKPAQVTYPSFPSTPSVQLPSIPYPSVQYPSVQYPSYQPSVQGPRPAY